MPRYTKEGDSSSDEDKERLVSRESVSTDQSIVEDEIIVAKSE